jgi:predicted AAA+ superfamily ATPase
MDAQPKLYILDPFIYYALYFYLNNVPDPFEEAKKLMSNEEFKGLLVESVVASYLLLAQQLFEHVPHVKYSKVFMYGLRESSEIDFVLCINKAGETNRFLIELKYRRQVPRISTTTRERYLIVLTQKELEVDANRRIEGKPVVRGPRDDEEMNH